MVLGYLGLGAPGHPLRRYPLPFEIPKVTTGGIFGTAAAPKRVPLRFPGRYGHSGSLTMHFYNIVDFGVREHRQTAPRWHRQTAPLGYLGHDASGNHIRRYPSHFEIPKVTPAGTSGTVPTSYRAPVKVS
mgnify:CR=1 FL=1